MRPLKAQNSVEPQVWLKADRGTLSFEAQAPSKTVRINYLGWECHKVVLADEVLELRFADGQVVITRKGKK